MAAHGLLGNGAAAASGGGTGTGGGTGRGRRRKDGFATRAAEKRFVCRNEGCERSFTRAEHLQRHLLNHSKGEFTCERCRAHFKRRDLLDRHMARHRQKDDEAGREGSGVLNTRKRMWKDAEGNIVTKKPALDKISQLPPPPSQPSHSPQLVSHDEEHHLQPLTDFHLIQHHTDAHAPISPPHSLHPSPGHSTFDDHDSGIVTAYPPTTLAAHDFSSSDAYSPIDQQFWSSSLPQQPPPEPEPFVASAFNDAPFDEIFNPDTASSFNNPFTTMSNYNWLFDMDLSGQQHQPQPHLQMQPVMPDPFSSFQFGNHIIHQPSHAFDLQLDHMAADKPMSTDAQYGSLGSHKTDSPQHMSPPDPTVAALITPPLTDEIHQMDRRDSTIEAQQPHQDPNFQDIDSHAVPPKQPSTPSTLPPDLERPMSLLQPSRCLPIIDELARAQFLDLVDITQPVAPDGSLVTRDNPLLSLSCLQTYCDLFFTRFNTVYPLIHMSTFDPSHVDTLLLTSVLLLGATYGEKDAHQIAVCIHDVVRPQIFANAGFSAKPSLWVLQTILLVECFGKSRAGQKQHDMSHLFHGLLINLIRRSDCQTIRTPTVDDATDDLEDDWRTWVEAEQKKRLAFLCFMWDTQHAVLFCQSLCMSAFELRSNLPSSQALWEADSAESWHRLHTKQAAPPLFLTLLKTYLNPSTPPSSPPTPPLNALSRALLLHGLMSIAWDMQRRDQTALGVLTPNTTSPTSILSNWQSRLAASYRAWHDDHETFCTSYLSHVPTPSTLATEFRAHMASLATLYHAAHILLHTPFLDLQIYAGARHILGRAVARADFARSQLAVKTWVARHADDDQVRDAVWHAASLVQRGLPFLEDNTTTTTNNDIVAGARLWHLPWTVYLGTLVLWGVSYTSPSPPSPSVPATASSEDAEDDIIWNPEAATHALLASLLASSTEPTRMMRLRVEKKAANALAAVVSSRLAKVRWAVVRDAMMVLRGVVCWRVVGGAWAGYGGGIGVGGGGGTSPVGA